MRVIQSTHLKFLNYIEIYQLELTIIFTYPDIYIIWSDEELHISSYMIKIRPDTHFYKLDYDSRIHEYIPDMILTLREVDLSVYRKRYYFPLKRNENR